MIDRTQYRKQVFSALKRSPVTAILGPRQCGKTTLAREICAKEKGIFFDLESPQDEARLQNPQMALGALNGLIVLDEIQRKPDLFAVLRVLADRRKSNTRFLLLGSASPHLMRAASESLAGRIEFIELSGFNLHEVKAGQEDQLWLRGGFPRSFLAQSNQASVKWREGFVRTFLERDLPQLGLSIPAPTMRRFWTMLAHYHGQTWNASDLSRSLGLSDHTIRRYLDILTATFMIRQLQPWFENVGKRQVKAPKIYFRDSGIFHHLLSLFEETSLSGSPRIGASWEGFALEGLLQLIKPNDAYFWSTFSGAELDLLLFHDGKRIGFEFKFTEAPSPTRSMYSALETLNLSHLWVITPGRKTFPITERISVCGLSGLAPVLKMFNL